jgi:phosphate-selective porin OprO/OprP
VNVSHWTKVKVLAGAACLSLSVGAGPALAADDAEVAALKARLERQEKQIEQLSKLVEAGAVTPAAADAATKAEIGKLVDEYLKRQGAAPPPAGAPKPPAGPAEPKAYEVGKDLTFRASWRDGPYFETADKAFKLGIRGRWHNHWGWVSGDDATLRSIFNDNAPPNGESTEGDDGVIFRRARIGVQGTIWEVFDFVAEWEFASGSAVWREMWMGVTHLPLVQNFRVGHYKEPFSMEQLTSSRFITFVERSIIDGPVDDNLAYNVGFNVFGNLLEERVGYSAGVFRHTQDQGQDVGDGDYNYTGRLWFVPVYEHSGRCVVHVGGAASLRQPPGIPGFATDGAIRFRTRPYRIEPDEFLDVAGSSTPLLVEDYLVYNLEAAAVWGPLSVQAEYHHYNLDNARITGQPLTAARDIDYQGYYVFVSYFLTGENRAYSRSSGAFGRIKPHENFWAVRTGEDGCGGVCCGKGAWEIAARYAVLDLNDGNLGSERGELRQHTIGINWYWNPNMKVQANYEWFKLENTGTGLVPGTTRQFLMAFNWDF